MMEIKLYHITAYAKNKPIMLFNVKSKTDAGALIRAKRNKVHLEKEFSIKFNKITIRECNREKIVEVIFT